MNRIECARELIARYIGVETDTEQVKLKVLLDLYADAVLLDAKDAERAKSGNTQACSRVEAEQEEILRCAQNDRATEEATIPQSAAPTAPFTQGSHEEGRIATAYGLAMTEEAPRPSPKTAMKRNGKNSTHTHTRIQRAGEEPRDGLR